MPAIPCGRIRLAILFLVPMTVSAEVRCGETARREPGRSIPVRVANLSDRPKHVADDRSPAESQEHVREFGTGAKPAAPVKTTVQDDLPPPSIAPSVATNAAVPQPCDRGCCVCDPLHRAGHPEQVSWLAIASNNCRYGGYYVGGGLPLRGEQRCAYHEGTWGWDYFGVLFSKQVPLQWSHGRRSQGGGGAYKTDGPKLRHE